MAVYIARLLLLNRRQDGIRIATWPPARTHDALNRLLQMCSVPTRAWMGCLFQWA